MIWGDFFVKHVIPGVMFNLCICVYVSVWEFVFLCVRVCLRVSYIYGRECGRDHVNIDK